MSSTDATIISVGNGQRMLVANRQLLAAGITLPMIKGRRQSGFLVRAHQGVHGILRGPETLDEHVQAAQLVLPFAPGYRRTAASLLRWPGDWPTDPELVVVAGSTSRLRGVSLHATTHLPPVDVCRHEGLLITTPARTMCDLCTTLGLQRLTWLAQTLIVRGDLDVDELMACHLAFARRGRGGTVRSRQLLGRLLSGPGFAASELEQLYLQLEVAHDIPRFGRQVQPPWYEGVRGILDFCRHEEQLILELDSRAWHSIEQAIDDDRRRDRIAARHGYLTLRLGWAEVKHRPAEVAEEIIFHLRQRQPRSA